MIKQTTSELESALIPWLRQRAIRICAFSRRVAARDTRKGAAAVLLCFTVVSATAQEVPVDPTAARRHPMKPGAANSINPRPLPPRPASDHPSTKPLAPGHLSSSPHPDWTGGSSTWPAPTAQQGSRASTLAGSPAQIAVDLSLKAPTGLAATNDQTVCTQHGGFAAGLACHALLPQGRLALVWSYGKDNRVKGYRVYRVDGGQQSLVYTQDGGVDAHSWVVDPLPHGGYAGKCYAVSAYGTSEESKPSAAACLDPDQSIQKLSFSPLQIRQYYKVNRKGRDPADGTLDRLYAVGYNYTTTKSVNVSVNPYNGVGVALDDYVNNISEVGVLFDDDALLFTSQGHLRNAHILSAKLLLTVDGSWTQANIHFPDDAPNEHQTSCIARIGAANNFWWSDRQWVQSYAELAPGIVYGSTVSYDVKNIVSGWIDKLASNPFDVPKGFVLKGAEENLTAFTEKSCVTRYVAGAMRLEVTFRQ